MVPVAIPLLVGLAHAALRGPVPGPAAGPQSGITVSAPISSVSGMKCGGGTAAWPTCSAPYPMLSSGHPVDWFFVFKLNVGKFPGCGGGAVACPFGGSPQSYKAGLRYVYASSEAPALQDGGQECMGTTTADPVGATFDEVYNGAFHYLLWNDQFHDTDPVKIQGCNKGDCDEPWGHSKGMLSWNDAGEGFVMQVSTPSWPGSGSPGHQRKIGNTLGCIVGDDDIEVSQHFFALRLTKDDLVDVLKGLANASVVTDPANLQVAGNGGPDDVQTLVKGLGVKSPRPPPGATSGAPSLVIKTLSSGVRLIAKPSAMHVPPWQMVSAVLGGVPLRTATWWMNPAIPSTTPETVVSCWDSSLGKPGAVEIATTGLWKGTVFGLEGGHGDQGNHAKLGVSTTANDHYAIFGDENQQGVLSGTCESSQNGRGGLFFVMQNAQLSTSLAGLISGQSAPVQR